jgi:Holliday junction DNA helicase RuvA
LIARVAGRVVGRGLDHVVVDVQGLGYKIFVARQPSSDALVLHTHHEVREDAQQLFGFETREELALFEMLISVSKVGPKAAMSLLSTADPSTLAAAIAVGDVAALARAPGVGKKTAERLIVELRSKVRGIAAASPAAPAADDEAVAALIALGYSGAEAARALKDVPAAQGPAERVRSALRAMAR